MRNSLSWRRLAVAGLAVALAVSTAACGSDNDAGTAPDAGAGFPATVTGAYGTVSVPAKPGRVVALNVQVAEILVALGVQPVAVATTDKEITESFPWLAGVFTGTLDPQLLENYEANLEKIASYRPDLIAGSGYNLTEKAYPQATDVAPTFAGISAGNDDWDDTARALGKLVGTDAQGAIDGVERACATARQKVPGLAGKTYQWVATGDGQFRFGNGTWLECFGLKPAANQDNTQRANAAVSQERIEELNADVLAIWDFAGEAQKVKADPRFAKLPSATSGAVIWTDLPLASATNSPAPKSYDYLIQRVLPILEAAPASR
jgi:iron complex transport system substrate-binding protein